MAGAKAKTTKASPQVAIHLGGSSQAAWEQVLLPWFQSVAQAAIESREPVAVVTPSPNHSAFLRSQVLGRGVSLLGVKFLSPSRLRDLLLRGTGLTLPSRENLRLFLAVAADALADSPDEESALIAKSVARDPDHFLNALDQLTVAGWNFDEIDPPALRKLAARFEKITRGCGFAFVHEADAAIATRTEQPSAFSHLLVTGFNGAHWPSWLLLRSAVASSKNSAVLLSDPRDEARDLDEAWVGTWEERFGAAQPIPAAQDDPAGPLRDLAWSLTTGSAPKSSFAPNEHVHFLVGADSTEQAKAIVALTANFLCQKECERVGILFPRRGALARLVANYLEAAQIPHADGIAHLGPSVFDNSAWQAWLELQENPGLKTLLRLAHAPNQAKPIFGQLSVIAAEKILRRAYAEVLMDHIEVLREYCAQHIGSDEDAALVRSFEAIEFLPATAKLGPFLAATRRIFASLGWTQHASEIERLTRTWSDRLADTFSRRIYLRWLREVLGRPSITRDARGDHSYSRVHLLTYTEAESQTWSHLIFAGLNEETWPVVDDESGFIRDEEIDQWNQRNRILNRRALQRGSQGEGQVSVRAGRTLLLGSNERRQLALRRLLNLVETATAGIGATANLFSESFPSRMANPSEFFSRLYFAARGAGASQETMRLLQAQSAAWLKDWSPVDAQKVDSISVGRTRYAYDARRQLRPAGEYEFTLRHPPERAISLRVTQWEQALRWPALIWMKIFLGVESEEESGDAWALATGQWVHRWLAESASNSDDFVPVAEVEKIRARIFETARRFLAETEKLCVKCAHPLPDWWTSGWSNALYVADCLAARLTDLSDWTHLATERPLGSPAIVSLGDKSELRLRGRIDLILARGERTDSPLHYPDLWVVDYKTGRQRGFNLREMRGNASLEEKFRKQLVDGRGVQLGLYALAVHALGARDVRLSLLSRVDELEPQFFLQHVLAQQAFWQELRRMQDDGVFGMLGPVHSEFGFARAYPLATLGIDPDLLQEKWEMTHPAFAVESGRESQS